MRMFTSKFAAAAALIAAMAATPAHAGVLEWNVHYSGNQSLNGSAAGPFNFDAVFTTDDVLVGGHYTILSILGDLNGDAAALLAPGSIGGNDNLLFPGDPFVDNSGFSFSAGGVDYNVYASAAGGACAGYLQISSVSPGTLCDTEVALDLTVTQRVDAPAPLALLAFGLVPLGAARRRMATA